MAIGSGGQYPFNNRADLDNRQSCVLSKGVQLTLCRKHMPNRLQKLTTKKNQDIITTQKNRDGARHSLHACEQWGNRHSEKEYGTADNLAHPQIVGEYVCRDEFHPAAKVQRGF